LQAVHEDRGRLDGIGKRDGGNDCEWTLFNDQGDRAPDAIYEEMRVSPPPSLPFVSNLIGLVGVALSLSGIAIVVFHRDGHRRELTSRLSELPARRR
jgi:hypothetical protein